jgi:hypothetical protein
VIYILTIRFVAGVEPQSILFLLHASLTDHLSTLNIFFIIHNHGFAGSRVGGFMKRSIFKLSLVVPAILFLFPICIKCCLMLTIVVQAPKRSSLMVKGSRNYSLNCIKSPFSKGLNYHHLSEKIYLRLLSS